MDGTHPASRNSTIPSLTIPCSISSSSCSKGMFFLRHGETGVALQAPPGPAILVWDSLLRVPEIQQLEELPPAVTAMKEKDAKLLAAACPGQPKLAAGPQAPVLQEGAASKSAVERNGGGKRHGGAGRCGKGLSQPWRRSPHADTRDRAILALRKLAGAGAGPNGQAGPGLKKRRDILTCKRARCCTCFYGVHPRGKSASRPPMRSC